MSFRQERPYFCGPASLTLLQQEMGTGPQFSQHEWAKLAGCTRRRGTSVHGLKRCLQLIAPEVRVVRKAVREFALAIVYHRWWDHWVVVKVVDGVAMVMDPWFGDIETEPWDMFRRRYLNSSRDSYALVCE
jgi:ABC-type bacteriocin/lantibiotic exporter with double-glycine peptidase domain